MYSHLCGLYLKDVNYPSFIQVTEHAFYNVIYNVRAFRSKTVFLSLL